MQPSCQGKYLRDFTYLSGFGLSGGRQKTPVWRRRSAKNSSINARRKHPLTIPPLPSPQLSAGFAAAVFRAGAAGRFLCLDPTRGCRMAAAAKLKAKAKEPEVEPEEEEDEGEAEGEQPKRKLFGF